MSAASALRDARYLEKFPIESADPAREFVAGLRALIARGLAASRGTEERKLDVVRALGHRAKLTPAELKICELAACGATHDEIAAERGITRKTLHNHLAPIFDKLEPYVGERSLARIAYWVAEQALYEAVCER